MDFELMLSMALGVAGGVGVVCCLCCGVIGCCWLMEHAVQARRRLAYQRRYRACVQEAIDEWVTRYPEKLAALNLLEERAYNP